MAQAEDNNLSEDEKSSSEETMWMNKKVNFSYNGSKEWAKDECVIG